MLSRLSGQGQVVIGTPVANRTRTELEALIGLFLNTLALRVDLSGDPDVGHLLEQVRALTLAAQAHKDVPFEQVVEARKPVRTLAHTPVYQVVFVMQNMANVDLVLPGSRIEVLEPEEVGAQNDLWWSVSEAGNGGLDYTVVYARALFDAGTIQRWSGHWQNLLRAMVADDTQVVSALPLLSRAQRDQMLQEWIRTEAPYPQQRCIHELFQEQEERDGEALALECGHSRLSYGELNARANRLAHHLVGLGVRPDSRVARALERSPELVVAILATLKAGGAYVPLDPQYPAERLAFMLEDCRPKVVLTQSAVQERLPARRALLAASVLELDDPSGEWLGESAGGLEPAELGLAAHQLAYVIYTSGSTGQPKGVMVPHQGVVNYLQHAQGYLREHHRGAVLRTPLSFDATVTPLFAPLLTGKCLVLLASEATEVFARLSHYLFRDGNEWLFK